MIDSKSINWEQHKECIEDIALEISQSSHWRKVLFEADYNQKFLISKSCEEVLPQYIKQMVIENDLHILCI